jgi:hypothetical protein
MEMVVLLYLEPMTLTNSRKNLLKSVEVVGVFDMVNTLFFTHMRGVGITLTSLALLHFCIWAKSGPRFPSTYVMALNLCSVIWGVR